MLKKKEKNDYDVGDIVLIRCRIVRKTEDMTNKTTYRLLALGINMELDTNEMNIAGITTDIPNSQDEE